MYTYFDLTSLPLLYLNFPHPSFLTQAWAFIQQFRHVRSEIYFRASKFCKSISDYLINCIYTDFANDLYHIGALNEPRTFQGGEHGFWATPISFWEN